MAEICCEVASGTETTTDACEAGSRAARRRRMQLRRIRPVSGVEAMASPAGALPLRKRHRLEASPSGVGICRRDLVGSGMEPPVEGGGEASSNVNLGRDPRESLGESKASESPMPRYGMTLVCGRRREMEDAVSVRPDFAGGVVNGRYHFYGVFDGHGCSHVAVSCRDRMHEMVAEELERMESELTASPDWEDAMRRSFSRMDADVGDWRGRPRAGTCRCDVRTLNCDHVGSTAVVAVVTSKQIVVANCGDSRAVLCRGRAAVPLSSDHKPDRVDEMERIEAAGGRVIYWDGARVLGVLAMSRAIGDAYLKPFVISEPEVTITERDVDDECLILASDGLWDVVSNQMACDIARMCLQANGRESERGADAGAGAGENTESGSDRACSDAAMLLTKLALARHSADNVSVVVIDLKRR